MHGSPTGTLFVSDVVDALDLSAIFAAYVKTRNRGRAGYHPAMMVKLLVYGYAIGVTSSPCSAIAAMRADRECPFRLACADPVVGETNA